MTVSRIESALWTPPSDASAGLPLVHEPEEPRRPSRDRYHQHQDREQGLTRVSLQPSATRSVRSQEFLSAAVVRALAASGPAAR